MCLLKYRVDDSMSVYSNILQRYEKKLIASGQRKFEGCEKSFGFCERLTRYLTLEMSI
jgi:hypothetical protein